MEKKIIKRKIHVIEYLISAALLFMSSCQYTTGYYIEQDGAHKFYDGEIDACTWIWHYGNIVKSWECPIENITPNTMRDQKQAAEEFVKELKGEKTSQVVINKSPHYNIARNFKVKKPYSLILFPDGTYTILYQYTINWYKVNPASGHDFSPIIDEAEHFKDSCQAKFALMDFLNKRDKLKYKEIF